MATCPRMTMMSSAGQLSVEVLQDLVGVRGDGSQIAILRAGIDINDRLHVVMVDRRSPRPWARPAPGFPSTADPCCEITGIFIKSCRSVMRYCGRLHRDLIGDADSWG